jgi:ABC-2 type transporter
VLLILTKLYRYVRDRHARGHLGERRRPSRARASRASGGLLELALHQARYDLRAMLRNKQARYSTLILPPLLLVLLVSGLGGGSIGGHGTRAATYAPGVSALGVLLACFANLAVWLSVQRDSGVLKRRRTAPVPASALIAGRSLAAMATSLAAVAAVLVLAHIAYHVGIPLGAVPALAATAPWPESPHLAHQSSVWSHIGHTASISTRGPHRGCRCAPPFKTPAQRHLWSRQARTFQHLCPIVA